MNLKERAAASLDASLDAECRKVGIRTEQTRAVLAAYLDGAIKLRASLVRKLCAYLEMVAR